MNFHYVYILVSESDGSRHYTGLTIDPDARLKAHNNGQVPHTTKYRPCGLKRRLLFVLVKKPPHSKNTSNPTPVELLPPNISNICPDAAEKNI